VSAVLVRVAPAGAWVLCPRCRIFVDQLSAAVDVDADIRCPWCQLLATVPKWLDAGARDTCECGCPRACHSAYVTTDGKPPGGGNLVRVVSAACVTHGCVRVSGAREVRLS
jgi:hypothetical protein